MSVVDWIGSMFGRGERGCLTEVYEHNAMNKVYYRQLAIQTSINLIANTLSKAEFQTFVKGKEVIEGNYYLFNIEPNPNKSASEFWGDVVHRLVYDNECLVVQQNEKLYVADSYDMEKFAFKPNVYKNVCIENYEMSDIFKEKEVMHFKLNNKNIREVITKLTEDYSELIDISQTNYKKNNSRKAILNIPTNYPKTKQAQEDLQKLFNTKLKDFFQAKGDAVLPLTNGEEFKELSSAIGSGRFGAGEEIKGFINDVFDYTAIALHIPPVLLRGEVADTKESMNNFLTFCINPIAEIIEDETNRKYYGKELFISDTYLKLDTTNIKNIDITDVAGSLDILMRIGAFTVNDCLKILGKEKIVGEIGEQRFMTKNYQTIEENIAGEADFTEVEDTAIEGGE